MMLAIRPIAVVALFSAAALLPFLPGRYDPVAGRLSAMAPLAGEAGLLLVQIGAAGLMARSPAARRRLARVAVGSASLAWLLGALAAAVHGSMLLGAAAVVAWIVVLWRTRGRIGAAADAPRALPAAVLIVPAAIGALQLSLSGAALEACRSRAIGNAATLIADIEQHRARHGRYPEALSSVVPDYPVSIVGIERFRYEPSGDAYNCSSCSPPPPSG